MEDGRAFPGDIFLKIIFDVGSNLLVGSWVRKEGVIKTPVECGWSKSDVGCLEGCNVVVRPRAGVNGRFGGIGQKDGGAEYVV